MLELFQQLDVGNGSILGDYKVILTLTRHFKWKNIIETGTNHGLGAITFCLGGASHVTTIDPVSHPMAREYIRKFRYNEQIVRIQGMSKNVLPIIKRKFDVAFIDGDHSPEGARSDFELVRDKVEYVLFHDSVQCEGVAQLKNELISKYKYLLIESPEKCSWHGLHSPELGRALQQIYLIDEDLYSWRKGERCHKSFPGLALFKVQSL